MPRTLFASGAGSSLAFSSQRETAFRSDRPSQNRASGTLSERRTVYQGQPCQSIERNIAPLSQKIIYTGQEPTKRSHHELTGSCWQSNRIHFPALANLSRYVGVRLRLRGAAESPGNTGLFTRLRKTPSHFCNVATIIEPDSFKIL